MTWESGYGDEGVHTMVTIWSSRQQAKKIARIILKDGVWEYGDNEGSERAREREGGENVG